MNSHWQVNTNNNYFIYTLDWELNLRSVMFTSSKYMRYTEIEGGSSSVQFKHTLLCVNWNYMHLKMEHTKKISII